MDFLAAGGGLSGISGKQMYKYVIRSEPGAEVFAQFGSCSGGCGTFPAELQRNKNAGSRQAAGAGRSALADH